MWTQRGDLELSGRLAWVAGAAGELGRVVAARLAACGASLLLVDRDAAGLASVAAELGGPVLAVVADLTDERATRDAVAQAHDRFGTVDILVNAAGGFSGGSAFLDTTPAQLESMLDVNLRTTVTTCRAALHGMIDRGWGRIVTVGARSAIQGKAGLAAYAAAKAAVLRFTESLAAEVAGLGVTANCVLPGTLDTATNRAARPGADISSWVDPAAVADVIAFLVSDRARAVSGAAIPVLGSGQRPSSRRKPVDSAGT